MAFSYLGHVATPHLALGGTSAAVDTSGADLIVITVAGYFIGGTIPPDSKGNTYTPRTSYSNGSLEESHIFDCVSPTVGAGHTFTCNGAYGGAMVEWFSGVDTGAAYDRENGAGVNAATYSPGSVTPANNGSLLVTTVCTDTGTVTSIDSGFTITDTVAPSSGITEGHSMAYFIQSTAGAINPTWTTSASSPGTSAIAVYKPAAGGAATLFRRTDSDRVGSRG